MLSTTFIAVVLWACALGYAGLAATCFYRLSQGEAIARLHPLEKPALFALVIAHAVGLYGAMALHHSFTFGWAVALSAFVWAGLAVMTIESTIQPVGIMRVILLPAGVICAALPALFPGLPILNASNTLFQVHLALAMLAYSLFALAACHAVVMAVTDRFLHPTTGSRFTKPGLTTSASAWQQALFESMPALMTLERLLFRLVGIGFVLLSLTIATGIAFSLNTLGTLYKLDHKTVFTVLAWLLFGILLLGKMLWGWRGQTAVRITLIGFVCLVLGYVGSRFVLQVILHRTSGFNAGLLG